MSTFRRKRWALGIPSNVISDITRGDGLCALRSLLQAIVCAKRPGTSFSPDIELDNNNGPPLVHHQKSREFWNEYITILAKFFPNLSAKLEKYVLHTTNHYQGLKVPSSHWLSNGELGDIVSNLSSKICML
jgi:hypothetical protein